MDKYPFWIKKYVEIYSNLLNTMNKGDIAKECNISRETIFRYFKTNIDKKVDIDRIIYDNKKAQKHVIGSLAFDALVKKLQSIKVSDKIIQTGLTVSGDYVEKVDSTNRYVDMKDAELDTVIQNLFRKARNQRVAESDTDNTNNTDSTDNADNTNNTNDTGG